MIGDRWRKIRSGVKDGTKYEYFIGENGVIQGIPRDFVMAYAGGKRLAVHFVSADQGQVKVFRGGKLDFTIDSRLLCQLSQVP